MASTRPFPVRLSRALSAIMHGVYNPWDESDDLFTPFHVEIPADAALDDATLRAALEVSSRYSLDRAGVDFAEVADNAGEDDIAASWRTLGAIMGASLTDVVLIHARAPGVVRVRTWLIGRAGGWLVGLRTTSTET